MTTTTLRCNGINHTDQAREVACKKCGTHVARREDGKTFTIRNYHTEGGYERHVFSCYSPQHKCDPAQVALYQDAQARDIAEGKLVPGQRVVVARGRKIAKGTTGRITWTGESDFGPRARVQPDTGEAFFIASTNLDVAS